jgi:hypothetical protein
VLSEVLKEIEAKTGMKVSDCILTSNSKPSDATVKEKKRMAAETNKKILDDESNSFSESTIERLKNNFE